MEVLPKVDDVSLKILFLLIPGIVAFFLIKSVGPKRPRSDFESGLQIFLYGVSCYALAGFIEGALTWAAMWQSPQQGFWDTVTKSSLVLATLNPQRGLGTGQIGFAALVAILLGLAVSSLQTHSIPHRILRYFKLTKRTSEVDMCGFAFNAKDIDSWITVRHPNGKVYQGWVRGYSDGDGERELLLADVEVFAPSTTDPMELTKVDTLPVLYLGLEKDKSVVELRTVS